MIMKEIERDFPQAPTCKEGCNCIKESEKLIRLTEKERRWECATCKSKENFKIGDDFGLCVTCGKDYEYRRHHDEIAY